VSQMTVRWVRCIALLGVAMAALAACSGPAVTSTGTLKGHLYGVGGPSPGAHRPFPGTITVTGTGFRRDVRVGADGAYSLVVRPGHYAVVAHSPHLVANGAMEACCPAHGASVASGSTTTLDTICSLD